MGEREPERVGVDDDDDVTGDEPETILEPQPQFLHPVQRPLRERRIAAVVTGRETQRFRLDPRHGATLLGRCCRQAGLDEDWLAACGAATLPKLRAGAAETLV